MRWRRRHRTLLFAGRSDIGRVRTENQDTYGIFSDGSEHDPSYLFVVADGMGGHEKGREASALAVEAMRSTYFSSTAQSCEQRLKASFDEANRCVRESAHSDAGDILMGTTCTALAVAPRSTCIGHIGDSRAYLIDHSSIRQLTPDHTVAEELHREGLLTEAEVMEHPNRHVLMRAIGIEAVCTPDIFGIDALRKEQRVLLCSDGLARVDKNEIARIVGRAEPEAACEKLIELANERGGHDNITTIVVAAV